MSKQILNVAFIDSVHPILQQKLEQKGLVCHDFTRFSLKEIEKNISNIDGIVIRSRFKVNRSFIEKAISLKFIARSGSGMENIEVTEAEKRGIALFNSPEGNRTAVAEHAMGMLLALFNQLKAADTSVRQGKWHREEHRGLELSGKTVGLIGYGNTGSTFAQRLQAFDVNILAYDKYKSGFSNDKVQESSWSQILEEADVLSLHIPLTEDTLYLIDEKKIEAFKKPFYLINTSRGKNVNTQALLDGIDRGQILGAGLDVLDFESSSFTLLNQQTSDYQRLMANEKVLLSPHVAGWTHESYYKLSAVLYDKIEARFFNESSV